MANKVPKLAEIKPLKFKKIPKRKMARIEKILLEGIKESAAEKERQEKERYNPKKETEGTCHCGGDIVLLTTYPYEYTPGLGPDFGPASAGRSRRVAHKECYCEECGALYKADLVNKRK